MVVKTTKKDMIVAQLKTIPTSKTENRLENLANDNHILAEALIYIIENKVFVFR